MGGGEQFIAFTPIIIFAIPFAVGNYFLADRMGQNKILWVVLTLIPFVNFVFAYYVIYVVIFHIIDKLNQLTEQPEASSP